MRLAPLLMMLLAACGVRRQPARTASDTPLKMPTAIGMSIDEVRKAVTTNFGVDEALDQEDKWVQQGAAWRTRWYSLEVPPVALDVHYRYRVSDGRVWAVRVAHAFGRYSGTVGEIDLAASIPEIEGKLGAPTLTTRTAPVMAEHVWIRGNRTYVVEALAEDYDDIALSGQKGDVRSVFAYSSELAPRDFVGYEK